MAAAVPRIVGVTPDDPFDPWTWSRASRPLFRALQAHGALAGAVDAEYGAVTDAALKVASFWPRRARWVERFELSPLRAAARSRAADRKAAAVDPRPDALLQIGAYYDMSRTRRVRPGLRASYHDSNLALSLRHYDFVEDRDAPHVRRALAFERRVYDGVDLIMPMSEWLGRSFVEDFGQDPGKVVAVGAGLNREQLPEPARVEPGPPRLLFVGFEFRRKGGFDLLSAFAELRAEHPEAVLSIVGPAAPDDVPGGVDWVGPLARDEPGDAERLDRLHRDATAFVLPSSYDPFPNVYLEAMAYGLPCVGTRVCGIPEMVVEGETGLLVEPGDRAGLADALRTLAADPERARAMGRAGRERVAERFTWKAVTTRMLAAMRERL